MARRTELLACLDEWLQPGRFRDYCPNGLQVEGREEIGYLMCGVTASQALLEEAQKRGADALLVHHGYFWRNESPVVVGMKAHRLRLLLGSGINLLAYHLPLDAHEEMGNNVQLARVLEMEVEGLLREGEPEAGRVGRLRQPRRRSEFSNWLESRLGRPAVWAGPGTDEPVTTVGWCTGAGQSFIERAAELGLDAFISGEISEPTAHVARECGLHYFACGHHATERYGVQAVGEHLAERFGLRYEFVDIPESSLTGAASRDARFLDGRHVLK